MLYQILSFLDPERLAEFLGVTAMAATLMLLFVGSWLFAIFVALYASRSHEDARHDALYVRLKKATWSKSRNGLNGQDEGYQIRLRQYSNRKFQLYIDDVMIREADNLVLGVFWQDTVAALESEQSKKSQQIFSHFLSRATEPKL